MNSSSEGFHGMLFFCKIFCNILLILYINKILIIYNKNNKNVITNQCIYSYKIPLLSLLLTKISVIMISQKDHIKYIKMQHSERRCIEKIL